MCKYCKDLCNSDDVPSVRLGRIGLGEIAGREISMSMDLDCYEREESGMYKISSMFDMQGFSLDAIISIEIKYCPFCGRKLNKD